MSVCAKLKKEGHKLTHIIRDGMGIMINSHDGWTPEKNPESTFTYTMKETGLKAEVWAEASGSAVVISSTVQNTSDKAEIIETIDPLHLIFEKPCKDWRMIYANGGTVEQYYPPSAYTIHEFNRFPGNMTWSEPKVESHENGKSSDKHLPIVFLLDDETGEGFFCGLEWSGAWYIRLNSTDDKSSYLSAGVKINKIVLEPGEKIELPKAHIGFFKGGDAEATNALRKYLYENVCPLYNGQKLIPKLSYDHWYGISERLSFDLLKKQADRAAELGVEIFSVDAAWFEGSFPFGVGNWNKVDMKLFPEGLEPLAEHVKSLGMKMGLWFEPERAVEGTQIIKEHPEWFVRVKHPYWEGNQYHINLAIKEAQDYLIEMVGAWIEKLDLHWSRWDYNIDPKPFWDVADPTMKIQFDYYKGLYRVLDTLMERYPHWMVEMCASGGRRIDIGTIKRSHTTWFSDHSEDFMICRYMQARANRFLPGHLLNSSIAVGHGFQYKMSGGYSDATFLSRMLGKLAFDGDIAKWPEAIALRAKKWADEYKKIRHLVVQDYYQLLPVPNCINDWDASQFADYEGDESAVFVFSGAKGGKKTVHLEHIDKNCCYVFSDLISGKSRKLSGMKLLSEGISIKLDSFDTAFFIVKKELEA